MFSVKGVETVRFWLVVATSINTVASLFYYLR